MEKDVTVYASFLALHVEKQAVQEKNKKSCRAGFFACGGSLQRYNFR